MFWSYQSTRFLSPLPVWSFVLPDTSRKSRQKTRVLRRTADPAFNHTMVYDGIREADLSEACVELTVWDRDRLASNLLGGLRLGPGTGTDRRSQIIDEHWSTNWHFPLKAGAEYSTICYQWTEHVEMLVTVCMCLCRQKLRIRGGLDGLNSLRGGPLGAHEDHPEWVGGGRPPIKSAELCQNCFQISKSATEGHTAKTCIFER